LYVFALRSDFSFCCLALFCSLGQLDYSPTA
jgi:hypothetical protein